MGGTDFIPSADADFHAWQGNFMVIVQASATAWGILPADVTALVAPKTAWESAWAKASNKNNRTSADVQLKKDAREAYENLLRKFQAQWISGNTKVTDADRVKLGVTVKSSSRTAVAVPSSTPLASIDFSTRLQHTIHFFDEATPNKKAKPEGVHGCEIWAKIGGDAPKDQSELAYLATDTANPYLKAFTATDAGKTAHYWLRWVNTRGEQGPWSAPVSAMIVG